MGYIFNCQPLSGHPIGTEWSVNFVQYDHIDATATSTGEVVTLTSNQFESVMRYAERD